MIQILFCLIICSLSSSWPLGPLLKNPTEDELTVDQTQQLISSGLQQQKMGLDEIDLYNQLLFNDMQSQVPTQAGIEVRNPIDSDLQNQELLVSDQHKQSDSSILQSIAEAVVMGEQMAADGLHNQLRKGVDFQKQLINTALRSPQMVINGIQNPLKVVQSMPFASTFFSMPQLLTSQTSSSLPNTVFPMVDTLTTMGRFAAIPINLISPIMNAAMTPLTNPIVE